MMVFHVSRFRSDNLIIRFFIESIRFNERKKIIYSSVGKLTKIGLNDVTHFKRN